MKTLLAILLAMTTAVFAAEKFTPLWNGKTLQGWHVIGKGEWKIEDAAIHGTHVKSEKECSHLVTDRDYTNFIVRLKFKAMEGNSGFYFRVAEKGFSGVTGFQAEIDATKDVGGLYETNGRSWVSQPRPDQVTTWFKTNAWNEMAVTARGGDITVTVNGKKTSDLKNDSGRAFGKFALQVHGGQECDVWFKDIDIVDLP
ncbi:MAG TPA: DUF1080 domain-containing protein [Candidatus Acidoferrum sp.]|nr:DUF1080 domain-containing protein [Candidatus Acidoferrum sp.]